MSSVGFAPPSHILLASEKDKEYIQTVTEALQGLPLRVSCVCVCVCVCPLWVTNSAGRCIVAGILELSPPFGLGPRRAGQIVPEVENSPSLLFSFSLSLSCTHTHTHAYTLFPDRKSVVWSHSFDNIYNAVL